MKGTVLLIGGLALIVIGIARLVLLGSRFTSLGDSYRMLAWPMPRWQLTDAEWSDLLAYL